MAVSFNLDRFHGHWSKTPANRSVSMPVTNMTIASIIKGIADRLTRRPTAHGRFTDRPGSSASTRGFSEDNADNSAKNPDCPPIRGSGDEDSVTVTGG